MKATELISELEMLVKINGDYNVYFEYDSGIRVRCIDVKYFRRINENDYSDQWGRLRNVFIINHEEE